MTEPHNMLPEPLTAAAVRSFINFDGGAHINPEGSAQAALQSCGVAAIWHLLNTRGYAYLADEVGMGKTRQALGVIAAQFLSEPDSHVIIVCPGKTLQAQWAREWDTFIRTCYKSQDDRLVSKIDGRVLHRPQRYERLSDFAKGLLLNEHRIHLLRYSSFRRPIWFGGKESELATAAYIGQQYLSALHEIGIDQLDASEVFLLSKERGDTWRASLTADLNEAYARRIGKLLKSRSINLVTLDEAQYLRHVDNRQNTNLTHVLRGHVDKWQFLSATPLHSGPGDILSLDTYLCRLPEGHNQGKACGSCNHRDKQRCSQAHFQTKHQRHDVVQVLREFMVRRPRMYIDGNKALHNKIGYRHYRRVPTSAANDPFLALSMALVQKHLVHLLDGQNNRFRQGECSSFESLSASVKRMRKDRDGNLQHVREIDHQEAQGGKPPEETIDRGLINRLNASFFAAMQPGVQRSDPPNPRYNLPHAKLNQVSESLATRSLREGVVHKTLVFVRRVDTVNELVLSLLTQFQQALDERLGLWHSILSAPPPGYTLREELWPAQGFWSHRSGDDNDPLAANEDDVNLNEADGQELDQRSASLSYFAALKKVGGKQENNGLLLSFHSRLLSAPNRSVPFAGFLLHRAAHPDVEDQVWEQAEQHWQRLLQALFGADAMPDWLRADAHDSDAQWKIATLKRCILQSMRHSEFLVDLYILNRYLRSVPGAAAAASLPEKLIALLREDGSEHLPQALRNYLRNWKRRLRLWVEHFDLIVDKCLRKDGATEWARIYANVNPVFARMAPVVGRSGLLPNQNAVAQFNFPTYPNILVCTDVLKEGVDMHLFCDEVVHYGVAWTSGDLEQRIGRIDRFGSQISRRLALHTGQPEQVLPRLSVEFPYFEGTLDRYQVERVMLAKVKSDLRMDLGKQEHELGHITISHLDHPDAGHAALEPAPMQYPASTAGLLNGAPYQPGAFSLRAALIAETSSVHRPELEALVVRTEQSAAQPLLRQVITAKGQKSLRSYQLEYLVRVSDPVPPEQNTVQHSIAFAVTAMSEPGRFRYVSRWNTLAQEVRIANPFLEHVYRSQTVLLERLQDFHLLRTPVARLDDDAGIVHWDAIITTENKRRHWGYLVAEHNIVWFVCLALAPSGVWLDRLCERVAKVGDRLQHLHTQGRDDDHWEYRAPTSISDITAAHAAHFRGRGKEFMSMVINDLQAHGRLLAGAQQWLGEAFQTVLSLLYGDDAGNRGLTVSEVNLLPNGVLHIYTTGKERFNLEVYLDLNPAASESDKGARPRMIWQVVTSTNFAGPKPELVAYSWESLPHTDPSIWRMERSAHSDAAANFTEDEKGRRYATFYHSPEKWDHARTRLSSFWSSLLERLRTQNFQRKHIADAYILAVDENS